MNVFERKSRTAAEMVRSIPIMDDSLVDVRVNVRKGGFTHTHDYQGLTKESDRSDDLISLLFDLSLRGGIVTDLKYDVEFKYLGWPRTRIELAIYRTDKPSATDIDADFIEHLAYVLGYERKEHPYLDRMIGGT